MASVADKVDEWFEVRRENRVALSLRNTAWRVSARIEELKNYSDADLGDIAKALAVRISREGTDDPRALSDAFALAAVAAHKALGFYPNERQLIAAILLSEGTVIEMRTGEGKTLMAMLAAYWQVLSGRHVDIATSNDYLALRDQRWMGLAYGLLGVSVGVVISSTPHKDRKGEYEKNVTYVANQELGFDYLRDNLAMDREDEVAGPHDMVIIDEADAILIDEARTALIISEPSRDRTHRAKAKKALEVIGALEKQHYTVDYKNRSVGFTEEGIAKISQILTRDPFSESDTETIRSLWYALYARIFFKKDDDYIIENGRLVLVDEFTGHALPDRVLFEGMQEAVELEAGIEPSPEVDIRAAITYRNFFRHYGIISGMTGTAHEAREEFSDLYDLSVFEVEPFSPSQRRDLPTKFFRTEEEKIAAIVKEIKKSIEEEMPVLVVGRSISSVERLSKVLEKENVKHALLHAGASGDEDAIIRGSGLKGAVTIATNMAGRGADIVLDESIRYTRGLRVLGLELNMSRRVDDQLRGRAGRQGQPGETRFFASLEDELFQVYTDDHFWDVAERMEWPKEGVVKRHLQKKAEEAEEAAERAEAEVRKALTRFDSIIDVHRNEAYRMRRRLLHDGNALLAVREEIGRILVKEQGSKMQEEDLRLAVEEYLISPDERHFLDSLLFGNPKEMGEVLVKAWEADGYTGLRHAMLACFDREWRQYLDFAEWLAGWISVVTVGARDPYEMFLEETDRMFHAAKRNIAIAWLEVLLKEFGRRKKGAESMPKKEPALNV